MVVSYRSYFAKGLYMKVTILGSGTCASQLPGICNRYPPAFLVGFGGEKILFECSEGVRFRLEQAGFDYADIHHIAVSHAHADHCALVHYVQSVFCKGLWDKTKPRNEEIQIYAPKQIADDFHNTWNFHLRSISAHT